jgi:hypothetical protein
MLQIPHRGMKKTISKLIFESSGTKNKEVSIVAKNARHFAIQDENGNIIEATHANEVTVKGKKIETLDMGADFDFKRVLHGYSDSPKPQRGLVLRGDEQLYENRNHLKNVQDEILKEKFKKDLKEGLMTEEAYRMYIEYLDRKEINAIVIEKNKPKEIVDLVKSDLIKNKFDNKIIETIDEKLDEFKGNRNLLIRELKEEQIETRQDRFNEFRNKRVDGFKKEKNENDDMNDI